MSDNEEDVERLYNDIYPPSYVLLAIDTHPSMFVKTPGNNLTCFEICIRACYEIADSLLLTHKRNGSPFAVVLANVTAADNENDRRATIIDFQTNMIDVVKYLRTLSHLSLDDLVGYYQRRNLQSFDLGSLFLLCKRKLRNVHSRHYQNHFIYLTNDDNPVITENGRFTAVNEARTFAPNNIRFEMITMNKDFTYSIFYNELFSLINGNQMLIEQFVKDADGMLDKLSNSIVARYHQRLLPLYIDKYDHKRFLRVIQKKYVTSGKILNNYHTTTTGRPVKKITVPQTNDEKPYSLNYRNTKIDFNQSEYDDIKNNDLPIGYSLIYISNRVTPRGFVLNDPLIIERDPKENLPYFMDLWLYAIDRKSVYICARKLRKNDKIRYFELIPKCIDNKPTFLAKHVPFASEIRYPTGYPFLSKDQAASVSRIQYFSLSDVFKFLKIDFHPKMFPSIRHMRKENYIKAQLLDEEEREVNDVVIHRPEINERVLRLMEIFMNELNNHPTVRTEPHNEDDDDECLNQVPFKRAYTHCSGLL